MLILQHKFDIQPQTHLVWLLYATVMVPYIIFAFLTLCDVTDDVTGDVMTMSSRIGCNAD